jgi:hypothetical protein
MTQQRKKRGRGRPSLTGETGERYQVTIPPRVARLWRKVGNGSISAGVSRNWTKFQRELQREEIRSNERQIEMLKSGKMRTAFGAPLGSRADALKAARRLQLANEELHALLRYDEAWERWQKATRAVTAQFWPHGNGEPLLETVNESEAAHAELKLAEAERDRIMRELRSGARR